MVSREAIPENSTRAPLVELRGAALGYGRTAISPAFDFALLPGDFTLLVGPNGAGKSTLARTLMGVLEPVSGTRTATAAGPPGRAPLLRKLVGQTPGAGAGRPVRFGYVPQRERLDELWPFSVLDIALMGAVPELGAFRRLGAVRKRRALEVLEQVGIAEISGRPFRGLSGGQQQRALIARALVAEPDVLVLDEPTNHLDVPGERAVYELLGAIHRSSPEKAIFVITHHLEPALPVATRVVVMRPGEAPRGGPVDEMVASDALDDLRVAAFAGRPA